MRDRVLVVKLSALGDFLLATGAFKAIRGHHPEAEITLLTSAALAELAAATGAFDAVWVDPKPRPWDLPGWLALRRRLRRARFARVYDLQWSTRSNAYARFVDARATTWVGVVPGYGLSYPGRRKEIPIYRRHAEMLALAGIERVPPPDLGFLDADISHYDLPPAYALLIPGSSPSRTASRWPAARYGELACRLEAKGLTPVLIRGPSEIDAARTIVRLCPAARDIDSNRAQIVALARRARLAVGNDTGPAHMAALAGCPLVAVFGEGSDPVKMRPVGDPLEIVVSDRIARLGVDEVEAAVDRLLALDAAAPALSRPGPASLSN